jgi:hypothetical protein
VVGKRDSAMLVGLAALEATDWSRLYHAYGPAVDTPAHLRGLLKGDRETRNRSLDHLWSAILHQGTPFSATGPVVLVLVGFLYERELDRGEPIRAKLLSFLAAVAKAPEQAWTGLEELESMAEFDVDGLIEANGFEALFEDEKAVNSFFARSVLGCVRVLPAVAQAILSGIEHNEPRVRACAAMGAAILSKAGVPEIAGIDLANKLVEMAGRADVDERCAHVLALGDLGYSPREFVDDMSPAVRMCAALAPGLSEDSAALQVLLDTAERHLERMDEWFTEPPPQFSMRPRFSLAAALIQRVRDFDSLAECALAFIGVATRHSVDFDWGPLLAHAFSDGSGVIQSDAQRRFLKALVAKAELWDSVYGNPLKWFKRAGLVYDRSACLQKLSEI